MRVKVELDRGDGLVTSFVVDVKHGFTQTEFVNEAAALEMVLQERYGVAWWQK